MKNKKYILELLKQSIIDTDEMWKTQLNHMHILLDICKAQLRVLLKN
jgi:hypothetical protein